MFTSKFNSLKSAGESGIERGYIVVEIFVTSGRGYIGVEILNNFKKKTTKYYQKKKYTLNNTLFLKEYLKKNCN